MNGMKRIRSLSNFSQIPHQMLRHWRKGTVRVQSVDSDTIVRNEWLPDCNVYVAITAVTRIRNRNGSTTVINYYTRVV